MVFFIEDDILLETPRCTKFRIVVSFALHIIFTGLITACLFISFGHAGINNDINYRAGFGSLTAFSVLIQVAVFVLTWKRFYVDSINISLLAFTLSTMVSYGFGLYYNHKRFENELSVDERNSCVNLKSDMFSYVVYLTTLAMMIVTNILYPYPTEEQRWMTSIQNGFFMLDFLDMAELIFSDFGCFINYGVGWLTVFFIAIGVSSLLLTTTRGLEQRNIDGDEKTTFDQIVTALNMIFNDLFFGVLRICVMWKEGHVYFGLIFVIKEFCTFWFRFFVLLSSREI